MKQANNQDRNFDDLAKRFKKNIYGGLKGNIRLSVLERDFRECFPFLPFGAESSETGLRVLDAGGGQGQFSLQFARAGHSVVICDISSEMLKLAAQEVTENGLDSYVKLLHCPIQDVASYFPDPADKFDLVVCHAVMEWVTKPAELLSCLLEQLKPQGYLSLTFYNLHSLIYKNLLRTNFKKIQQRDFGGKKGSLTPINPLDPELVFGWLRELPVKILATSGIRVFHDYIFNENDRERDPENLIALELEFSRKQPYQMLGRYIHVLAQKIS